MCVCDVDMHCLVELPKKTTDQVAENSRRILLDLHKFRYVREKKKDLNCTATATQLTSVSDQCPVGLISYRNDVPIGWLSDGQRYLSDKCLQLR